LPYSAYVDKVPLAVGTDVSNAEHALLYLVNEERLIRGLNPLCYNGTLSAAARAHSENWAGDPDRAATGACPLNSVWNQNGKGCAHWDSRPGLAWPEDRLNDSGYAHSLMAENTQYGAGSSDGTQVVPVGWTYGTPKSAVYWWMNHDPQNNYSGNGHRAAILNRDFVDAGLGVGIYVDGFGNHGATFTLMFGKP
jgi:uncharacterized protein YkwD